MKNGVKDEKMKNAGCPGEAVVVLGGEEAAGEQELLLSNSGAARTAETLLRLAPIGLCISALVIMLKNSQRSDFGDVSYSDLAPFKYLVYANGVLTYAILAAGATSAEVVYLAYNGDEEVTWSKECVVFGGFCRRATASVGVTFGAVICYVLISLISSYRLFSVYEAPLPYLSSKNLEVAAFPR